MQELIRIKKIATPASIRVRGRALSSRAGSEIGKVRPAEPRKRGAGERTWNHTVDRPNRRAPYLPPSVYPFSHSFTIATSTTIVSSSRPSLPFPPEASRRTNNSWVRCGDVEHSTCQQQPGKSPHLVVPAGKVAARLAIPAFLCWLWPWTGLKSKDTRERERAPLRVPRRDFPAYAIRHVTPQNYSGFYRRGPPQSSRYVIRRKDTSLWPAVPSRWILSPPWDARGWWTVYRAARISVKSQSSTRPSTTAGLGDRRDSTGRRFRSFSCRLGTGYGVDVAEISVRWDAVARTTPT